MKRIIVQVNETSTFLSSRLLVLVPTNRTVLSMGFHSTVVEDVNLSGTLRCHSA